MVNLQHFSRLSSLVIHLWQTWVLAPVRICTNILKRMHFLEKYTFTIPVCTVCTCFTKFTTCTSPIMHLICPPEFCITFVIHFSWVLQPSREKLKTMLMQNFGGQINGRCARGMFKNTADTPTKVIGFILNDTDVIYGEAG